METRIPYNLRIGLSDRHVFSFLLNAEDEQATGLYAACRYVLL